MAIDSPILATLALPLLAWIVWLTRRPVRRVARLALRSAAAMLLVAIAGVELRCDRPPTIAVLVDVSPSTRGGLLRDPRAVEQRLARLLNGRPASIHYFADGLQQNSVESNVAATRLEVPDADAVVLFSDGRFAAPPALPPVFAVIDPTLDHPVDGRVGGIVLGAHPRVETAIDGTSRLLSIGDAGPPIHLSAGEQTTAFDLRGKAVTVSLDHTDRWPENDALTALAAPPRSVMWSVDRATGGATTIGAAALPRSLTGYIGVAAILLPTSAAIDGVRAAVLRQYVETLGGALILAGPPTQVAAPLREIAPLSAFPPQPDGRWLILLDGSGSMGSDGKWPAALAAARRAVDAIDPSQLISLAIFSRTTRVIVDGGKPPGVHAALDALAAVTPGGPTGLRSALEGVARSDAGSTRVLLITDGDAELGNVSAIAGQLTAGHVRLFALLTARSSTLEALAAATGGASLVEAAPAAWAGALERLAAAGQTREIKLDTPATGRDLLSGTQFQLKYRWQAWPRDSARLLASASNAPVAAMAQAGLGRIVSWAAELPPADAARILPLLKASGDDPRFDVEIDEAAHRVRMTAFNDGTPINELSISMKRGAAVSPLRQTAPGEYAASLPPQPSPALAIFSVNGVVVAERAIDGRYPAEFDRIGNDRPALRLLADRTGGRLIDVDDRRPLQIPIRTERRSLRIAAAMAAFGLSLIGLILLRMPYLEDRIRRQLVHRPGLVRPLK